MDPMKTKIQKENKEKLISLCISDFLANSPSCDYNVLTPTYPTSLANVDLSKKEMAQIPLNSVILCVLCGTLFGDCSIQMQQKYTNARIQMRHSTRQTEWFMWKTLCILSIFTSEKAQNRGIHFQKPDGFQRKTGFLPTAFGGEMLGKLHYQSAAKPILTSIYKILCPSKTKTIQRSWLNHMNNYFLMALWLDDGSLNKGRQGVISCNNTPHDEAVILTNYITTVWGVKCKVAPVSTKITSKNPNPIEIRFSDFDNLEKWIHIIAPIVPVRSMLYKVCLYTDDPSFLQRWIPYLKSVLPVSWHNDIDKYYAYLGSID